MKKLLIALLMAASSIAMADNAVVEYTTSKSPDGKTTGQGWFFKQSKTITKDLDVDISLQANQSDQTLKSDYKVDVGIIPKFDIYGSMRGYTRVFYGEKFSSTGNYNYWGFEPGFSMPLGGGFSTKVGYRYRTATDSAIADTTRTARVGVSYDLTNTDSVGVRYDRMRGDKEVNYWNVNYVKNF